MTKKHKKTTSEPAPTKRQLSKWQRQMKIRRIVIIAAVALLVGIVGGVVYGYYVDYRQRTELLHEVVIKVNDASFTMAYYMNMLDVYTRDMDPELIYYMAGMVADSIIEVEVMRQYARDELGIEVTSQEIEARREQEGWADGKIYADIISSVLLQEKLEEYFDGEMPEEMEQAHVQVMLVESREVADEVLTEFEASGNLTALVDEFSRHPQTEGDLGWLPRELMPNTFIAEAAFNVTPGEIGQPIYDEAVIKNVGYWLIEVIDIAHDEDDEMEVEARAMLLGSKVEAQLVKAEWVVSGNFTSLAQEYSQHESRIDGGELGWLRQGDMDSEAFDEVAFNLAPNEVSEPVKDESVQTAGGYWLVEVVDRGERELEEGNREQLVQKQVNELLRDEKEKSTIENLLDQGRIWWAVGQVLLKR